MKQSLLTIIIGWLLVMGYTNALAVNYPPDNINVQIDSTNLPIVWIDVNGIAIDRDYKITGRMKIINNGEGKLNYADTVNHPNQNIDYSGYIAIRYRGHSSFNYSDKKPYTFDTMEGPLEEGSKKKKVSLLGMGKDNKWGLLAPFSDRSLIRDILAFQIARPWMEFTPKGKYCELYLDGTYYGVFLLTELVSKGKYRTNLDDPGDEGDSLTGGYIMQVDRADEIVYVSKYHPVRNNGTSIQYYFISFQYKSPDYDEITPEQKAYITGHINEMEATFASDDYQNLETGYRKYIDIMSFIDYQLVMEVAHSVDAYRLSSKFYKRRDSIDPRFKMAIWDLNIGFGNANFYDGWRTDTWIHESNNLMLSEGEGYLIPFWWYKLNNDPNYTALLKDRWRQYRRNNLRDDRIMATIDSLTSILTSHDAEKRNSKAWPRWGKYIWPNYHIPTNYADEISYLKQWIMDRIAWMDQELGYDPDNYLRGDVDGDDKVNIDDLTALIDLLLIGQGYGIEQADVNFDGKVDIDDISSLIDYLLTERWADS